MKKITVTKERADRLDMWNLGLFYNYEIHGNKVVFYFDERRTKCEPNLVKPT